MKHSSITIRGLFLSLATLVLTAPATLLAEPQYSHTGPLLLQDVTVIDGLGKRPAPHQDVLINDGRIADITVTQTTGDLPDGTKVLNGKGLSVMPGIIDMHVHMRGVRQRPDSDPGALQRNLNAFLYSGVTSVHDMDNEQAGMVKLRAEIANGERIGPNISTVGTQISRLQSVKRGIGDLTSPEAKAEIKERLDAYEADGITIIKLYGGLSSWSARHIMAAAKKRGITGIADFWCTNLSLTGFQVTNVDGWAHGGCWTIQPYVAEYMKENDKFAILTLTAFDVMGGYRPYEDLKTRAFLKEPLIVDVNSKEEIEEYYDNFYDIRAARYEGDLARFPQQEFKDIPELLPKNQRSLQLLHEAGVLIGMGTDWPAAYKSWPGESMHAELELHTDAGISPLDAIRMATYNGAKILKWDDDIGSVEEGKIADLLVVRGNPAEDIRNTRNVVHVIKGGKLIDRKSLKYK